VSTANAVDAVVPDSAAAAPVEPVAAAPAVPSPELEALAARESEIGARISELEGTASDPAAPVVAAGQGEGSLYNDFSDWAATTKGRVGSEAKRVARAVEVAAADSSGNPIPYERVAETAASAKKIVKAIEKDCGPWGITALRYEIKDIEPPSNISNAMIL
jgi:hypothetical protein